MSPGFTPGKWPGVLLFLMFALSAHAGEPDDWLQRMSAAMDQLSYQGTFVYIQDNHIETVRITHVADDNGVRERLVSMSGDPRELLVDSHGVRWVSVSSKSVLQDPAFKRSFFPSVPLEQYAGSYDLTIGTTSRVAGREALNLRIVPRDSYRYGYSLWLDVHSALLLKWELVDHRNRPLAKLMFTDFKVGSEVDQSELDPGDNLKKFKTVDSALPEGRTRPQKLESWRPDDLPEGFRLTDHRYSNGEKGERFEHLVYGDGLAAVSVYIESAQEGQRIGVSRLGTTHAFSRRADDVFVTVVGDVPAATVQKIGRSVSLVND